MFAILWVVIYWVSDSPVVDFDPINDWAITLLVAIWLDAIS